MLGVEKPIRAEARDQELKQHWVDFPGRKVTRMTKAQQKKLIGSVAMDESLLSRTAGDGAKAQLRSWCNQPISDVCQTRIFFLVFLSGC